MILTMTGQQKLLISTIVLQTIGANLGSMFTPVGNPQNLYLASAFSVSTGTFLMRMLPLTALSLILLVAAACMLPSASVDIASQPVEEQPEQKKAGCLPGSFCGLSGMRIPPDPISCYADSRPRNFAFYQPGIVP